MNLSVSSKCTKIKFLKCLSTYRQSGMWSWSRRLGLETH